MSDKQSRMRQRRHGFLEHQRRLRGEKKAVSPVVATLILILIAVAAAAALYLWLVVWQGNITGGIGTQHAEPTLQVGGSTSVYPFSSLAATWFEQNNSDVVISDNQGGTGAGMIALCDGNVDLGASSTPQTVATLEASYGCSSTYASTITITTIAYDAVDVVVASSNPHGLLSISADTLNAIYEAASTSDPSAHIGTINGVADTTLGISVTYNAALDWDQIPAAAIGASWAIGALYETGPTASIAAASEATGVAAVAATGVLCGTSSAGPFDDVCASELFSGTGTADTPCGFQVCAGGAAVGATGDDTEVAIQPVERSDASGTTQTFEAKLLGYGSGSSSSATSFATTQLGSGFANLGYGGCGSNNLLSDCGFTYGSSQQGNGNPGVLSTVAGNLNSIGYASDGLARTTTGVGTSGIIPFLGLGQGVSGGVFVGVGGAGIASATGYVNGAVEPTTGTSGTIAAGLTSSATATNYVGGRPFELISLEPLTGVAQEWVTFITDPAVNAALASATDEVGLYQVV